MYVHAVVMYVFFCSLHGLGSRTFSNSELTSGTLNPSRHLVELLDWQVAHHKVSIHTGQHNTGTCGHISMSESCVENNQVQVKIQFCKQFTTFMFLLTVFLPMLCIWIYSVQFTTSLTFYVPKYLLRQR
jgi:hypothetical protein